MGFKNLEKVAREFWIIASESVMFSGFEPRVYIERQWEKSFAAKSEDSQTQEFHFEPGKNN